MAEAIMKKYSEPTSSSIVLRDIWRFVREKLDSPDCKSSESKGIDVYRSSNMNGDECPGQFPNISSVISSVILKSSFSASGNLLPRSMAPTVTPIHALIKP